MKPTDIIFDSIRHEAKETTKDCPNMRFGVDWSSYWHNRNEYFDCMQKIKKENMQINNINMLEKRRGYITDTERNERNKHIKQRDENIAKALKHLQSASEDADEMCKFLTDMYWQNSMLIGSMEYIIMYKTKK
jgi:hypothetical protein